MTPILVPTLVELKIELERLDPVRAKLSAENDADPDNEALSVDWERATEACWAILDQVAALPATSLADLRVKAHVLNWSANLIGDDSYLNPSEGEEQILRQLVAGLLDEKLATGGVASVDGRAA